MNTKALQNNMQQQTKRLLDQLQQLQENKESLSAEQYHEIKTETLQNLHTFQTSLSALLSDPNNSILQPEIERAKRQIYEAVKKQSNKDAVVEKLLSGQVNGNRTKITELDKRFQLKSLPQAEYVLLKRKAILQIEEIGAKLTVEEEDWLQLHHHFVDKSSTELSNEARKKQLEIVQQKIERMDK